MGYRLTKVPCPECGKPIHASSKLCHRCKRYYKLTMDACPACGKLKHSGTEACWRCKRLPYRIVAAKRMGRCLALGECVHHINGDRTDNHPENLQVLPNKSEHGKIHFPGKEGLVWQMYAGGVHQAEIGRRLGISRQRVWQILSS